MSSYISLEEIHVFFHREAWAHGRPLITVSLFMMNCLTLAYALERAVFDTGYNSKAFQRSASVQAPAESPHFSDAGAGFEEQGGRTEHK